MVGVIYDNHKWTYKDLNSLVNKICGFLSNVSQKLILVEAQKTVEYICTIFACLRLNKIYLPISDKTEQSIIDKIIIENNAFYFDLNNFKHIANNQEIKEFKHINLNTPSNIILSSGSTGQPKMIVHRFRNHLSSYLGGQKVFTIRKNDKYLLTLPLNHVGGQSIIFKCLFSKATIVISQNSLPEAISLHHITHLSLVPTQIFRLLKQRHHLDSIKGILIGGDSLNVNILRQFNKMYPFIDLFYSYGSTEMATQICTKKINHIINKNNIIPTGFPLPYRDLKIYKNEILVKGSTLALGYLKDNKICPLIDENGWYHTKDCGYINNDGLFVNGRLDNQFICGGENIQPEAIEKQIKSICNINNIVVGNIRNDEWGNIVACAIELNNNDDIKHIISILQKEMNHIYIPKIWFNWPKEQPKTLKINRKFFNEYINKELEKQNYIKNLFINNEEI
jgi:O-succinylbenzoic acid--CoA ligase